MKFRCECTRICNTIYLGKQLHISCLCYGGISAARYWNTNELVPSSKTSIRSSPTAIFAPEKSAVDVNAVTRLRQRFHGGDSLPSGHRTREREDSTVSCSLTVVTNSWSRRCDSVSRTTPAATVVLPLSMPIAPISIVSVPTPFSKPVTVIAWFAPVRMLY